MHAWPKNTWLRPTLALSLAAFALPAQAIEVNEAWARANPPGSALSAAFLNLRDDSGAGDRLLAASSPVAGRIELHETSMEGELMRMRRIDGGLAVPAGGRVELRPGGLHLMLLDLPAPLTAGQTFMLQLQFEQAGLREVEVTVRAPGSGEDRGHEAHHHHH